jgi:hypothetical protein
LHITRLDAGCHGRVPPDEETVKIRPALAFPYPPEATAKSVRPSGRCKQTRQKNPKVEPGPPDHKRQPLATADLIEDFFRLPTIVSGTKMFVRVNQIEQMVRNALPGLPRDLSRADIQTAINLDGIAIQNLRVQLLGQVQSQGGFSGRRGPYYGYQRPSVFPGGYY